MRQKMKRFLSVLLAAAMAFTVSLPAFAEEGESSAVPTAENAETFDTVYVSVTNDAEAEIDLYRIIKIMDQVESEDSTEVVTEAYSLEWISDELKTLVGTYEPATWYDKDSGQKFKNGDLDLTTPALLNSLTQEEADAFYQWLAAKILADTYNEETNIGTTYKCVKVARTGDTSTTGSTTSHLFSNVQAGGYLALASGGVNVYRPTTVNLLPTKDGTQLTWDTSTEKNFTMKSSTPSIDKTVTDEAEGEDAAPAQSATVAAGDALSFDICTEVPEYSDDYTVKNIRYTMVDIISSVFTYNEDNPMTITGRKTAEDGTVTEETVLTSEDYATLVTAGKVYVNSTSGDILFVSTNVTGSNAFYWPDGGIMSGVTTLTGAIDAYNVANSDATLASADVSASSDQYAIIVDFSTKFGRISGYDEIVFHYNVTVGDTIKAGVDTNSNTANLAYSTSSANATETSSVDDTVIVYTYGVDISKVDGASNAGLNGVKFYLYKKIGTMTESEYNTLANGTEDQYQSVASGSSGNVDAYERIFADKELITGEVGDETGKLLVDGLDVGDYLLVEAAPLAGYNKLETPVKFTVKQDTDEPKYVESATGAASGYVALTVENMQGVTLPSTGGMGITMFLIFGVCVAGAAIILMGMQRKKLYR